MQGGPFGEKISKKKFRKKCLAVPKKIERGDSLVSPGLVCYAEKQVKPFWFSSLDQIVHFGAIIFCRTFVELFWSVRVDRKKKSHYNSRVSLHEAPTKNTNRLKILKKSKGEFEVSAFNIFRIVFEIRRIREITETFVEKTIDELVSLDFILFITKRFLLDNFCKKAEGTMKGVSFLNISRAFCGTLKGVQALFMTHRKLFKAHQKH